MGKPTGFIEWQRLLPGKRPVAERVHDWREVEAPAGRGARGSRRPAFR